MSDDIIFRVASTVDIPAEFTSWVKSDLEHNSRYLSVLEWVSKNLQDVPSKERTKHFWSLGRNRIEVSIVGGKAIATLNGKKVASKGSVSDAFFNAKAKLVDHLAKHASKFVPKQPESPMSLTDQMTVDFFHRQRRKNP